MATSTSLLPDVWEEARRGEAKRGGGQEASARAPSHPPPPCLTSPWSQEKSENLKMPHSAEKNMISQIGELIASALLWYESCCTRRNAENLSAKSTRAPESSTLACQTTGTAETRPIGS